MTAITIPKRPSGHQSAAAKERYDREMAEFCATLKQLDSNIGVQGQFQGGGVIPSKMLPA